MADHPTEGDALALALVTKAEKAAGEGGEGGDAEALAGAALEAARTPQVRADVQLLRIRLGSTVGLDN